MCTYYITLDMICTLSIELLLPHHFFQYKSFNFLTKSSYLFFPWLFNITNEADVFLSNLKTLFFSFYYTTTNNSFLQMITKMGNGLFMCRDDVLFTYVFFSTSTSNLHSQAKTKCQKRGLKLPGKQCRRRNLVLTCQ